MASFTKLPGIYILTIFLSSLWLQKHLSVCMIDISHGLETDIETNPDKGWKSSDSFSKNSHAPYHV